MAKTYTVIDNAKYVIGRGGIAFLGELGKKRAVVLYDGRIVDEELKKKIADLIEENGGECRFIADIRNEPYFSDIIAAGQALGDFQPDLIVAIGGGSVMDTAKAIWLFYEHPELAFEDAFKAYALPKPVGKAEIVAIPTTSGTGSETTSCAVFTNQETKAKSLMLSNDLIPAYAILDADFTDTLPATVAAHTGMDGLAHAMEAAVCVAASPMVVSLGLGAAMDLLENLPTSVGGEGEAKKKAREVCHIASSLAGVAITNSCAGLVHGFDQPGPYFNLPHGLVCGLLLPYSTAFHSPHPQYVTIAKRLGYKGNDKELCSQLVDHLWEFNSQVGLPHSFQELGLDEKVYFDKLPDFIEIALNSISTKLSPKAPTPEEAKALFTAAYYGEKPSVK